MYDRRAAPASRSTARLLADQAHPATRNRKLVKHPYAERHALFTFLADPTIDATSWRAEQGIRPAR